MQAVGANLCRASHGCLLREDADEQQCLVVLLYAVPFDFTHDQLPELREWLAGVVPEQLLEAIETEFVIFRVGYFRDPVRHHQKQILWRVSDALARIAPPGYQAQGKLLHGKPGDIPGGPAIVQDRRMACQRILRFGRAVKVQQRERRLHVRLLDRGKHAVRTFQYGHWFLSELQGDTYCRLQHPHQLAGGQAVSGNVSDIGEQRSVTLRGIDQVAAHFCAGNRFPVYLEAGNPK